MSKVPRQRFVVEPGATVGKWTVMRPGSPVVYDYATFKTWRCRCACGTQRDIREAALRRGDARLCSRCSYDRRRGHDARARFERFVDRTAGPDGCHVWTGATARGYGAFMVRDGDAKRHVGAHVFAWQEATGQRVPAGLVVMHSCDNRPCVNPRHLSVGTHLDNMRDAKTKGRHAHGPTHGQSKHHATMSIALSKLAAGETMTVVVAATGIPKGTVRSALHSRGMNISMLRRAHQRGVVP